MNPLWGLKLVNDGKSMRANHVPKSMNPLWGLKPRITNATFPNVRGSQKHESSLGIETLCIID